MEPDGAQRAALERPTARRFNGRASSVGSEAGWTLLEVTVAATLAAIIGAFGVTRLLESLLFGIDPVDPVTFVGVSALFGLVALVACLLPAWRAMRVDPITALSTE